MKKNSRGKKLQTVTFEGTYRQRLRRRKVFELRLKNFSIREMATALECSVGAIVRDLQSIEWALLQRIDPSEATAILNAARGELTAIKSAAWSALPKAFGGNAKAGLLGVIVRALEAETRLLQDAGIIPRIPREVKLGGIDGSDPIPVSVSNDTHIKVEIVPAYEGSPPVIFNWEVIDVAEQRRLAAEAHERNGAQ